MELEVKAKEIREMRDLGLDLQRLQQLQNNEEKEKSKKVSDIIEEINAKHLGKKDSRCQLSDLTSKKLSAYLMEMSDLKRKMLQQLASTSAKRSNAENEGHVDGMLKIIDQLKRKEKLMEHAIKDISSVVDTGVRQLKEKEAKSTTPQSGAQKYSDSDKLANAMQIDAAIVRLQKYHGELRRKAVNAQRLWKAMQGDARSTEALERWKSLDMRTIKLEVCIQLLEECRKNGNKAEAKTYLDRLQQDSTMAPEKGSFSAFFGIKCRSLNLM